jgi:hypothetical protein
VQPWNAAQAIVLSEKVTGPGDSQPQLDISAGFGRSPGKRLTHSLQHYA